uniref:TQXA domain-containing protein n=1 Tax=Streptomyces corallincola TaxID=2851888 RepID=UPI001FEB9BDC|nr:TQXA domain-containing protein [Streptomyces corallincola]
MSRSVRPVRVAAVVLTSGLVAAGVLSGAGTAAADDGTGTQDGSGATATVNGLKTYGEAVFHEEGGAEQRLQAGLFEMSVDGGGTLQTYGVDLRAPTQRDAHYQETAWSGTSLGTNRNAGKIGWILRNSYPQVNDLATLARRAGVSGLTEQDAAAGTQVAIWRYSDGADVDAVGARAEKLADYLEKNARGSAEPPASLRLDPPVLSGRPGDVLGPVTVHTNAGSVTVSPPVDATDDGVRIIDRTGKVITSARDGGQLYFDIPEDAAAEADGAGAGSARIAVQGSTTVPVGRAFVSESRSQTQILAGSSESSVSATAGATWTAAGTVPAVSARTDCARGGVDVTAVNTGDLPFTFTLLGAEHTVPAGASRTVPVPLAEDRPYDFALTGPGGFDRRFTGVLDCATRDAVTTKSTRTLTGPATALPVVSPAPLDTDLAATGGSAITPMIAGLAIGLVVIGGTVLVVLRRREELGE